MPLPLSFGRLFHKSFSTDGTSLFVGEWTLGIVTVDELDVTTVDVSTDDSSSVTFELLVVIELEVFTTLESTDLLFFLKILWTFLKFLPRNNGFLGTI